LEEDSYRGDGVNLQGEGLLLQVLEGEQHLGRLERIGVFKPERSTNIRDNFTKDELKK